mmetsp:Transcript_15276/g.30665  ORF Transcript_15276/g.30665 Transcript_15276/m.30665 type:complete len:201 (+) Transcript_15276:566-1168(+)
MEISKRPSSNFANWMHSIRLASSWGVRASGPKGMSFCSQCVTASRVSARKTLPFDQQTARGRAFCSLATVVPLPVPERPCSTSTQPWEGAPSALIISAATASALFPRTSITLVGSTGGSASSTPLSIALVMPAASFWSSSASRSRIAVISAFEKVSNVSSPMKVAMIAFEEVSSPARSTLRLVASSARSCLSCMRDNASL